VETLNNTSPERAIHGDAAVAVSRRHATFTIAEDNPADGNGTQIRDVRAIIIR
jgi:hypothetical protein